MFRRRSWVVRVAGTALLLGSVALATAPTAEAATTTNRLGVVAQSFHFTVSGYLTSPGPTSVRFVNGSREDEHEFVAFNLGSSCAGMTKAQAIALLDQGHAAFRTACPDAAFEGAAFAPPLQQDRETFNIAPGRTIYVCQITEPDGTPHYKLGMLGFFTAPGLVANP